jgi:TetR/AcrR family transcriptional repressor of nem operon
MARQREFDKQTVIERAMRLFWERGYEATSIRDLLDVMGISSSSLYEAFGDKRGVFLAALAQFCEWEQAQISQMAHNAPSPHVFIEHLFSSIDQILDASNPTQGSLALNTMVEYGTRDPDITQLLLAHYFGIAHIVTQVIQAGQAQGAIQNPQPAHELAHTLLSTLYGVVMLKGVKPDFAHSQAITQVVLQLLMLSPSSPP